MSANESSNGIPPSGDGPYEDIDGQRPATCKDKTKKTAKVAFNIGAIIGGTMLGAGVALAYCPPAFLKLICIDMLCCAPEEMDEECDDSSGSCHSAKGTWVNCIDLAAQIGMLSVGTACCPLWCLACSVATTNCQDRVMRKANPTCYTALTVWATKTSGDHTYPGVHKLNCCIPLCGTE